MNEKLEIVLIMWGVFSVISMWAINSTGTTLKEKIIVAPVAVWITTGILSVFSGVGLLVWRCYLFLKDGYWLHLTNDVVLGLLGLRVPPLQWRGVDAIVRYLLGWDSTLTLVFAVPITMIILTLLAMWFINSTWNN